MPHQLQVKPAISGASTKRGMFAVKGPERAVVVGMEANGLGVARSLHRVGIAVTGIGAQQWNCSYLTRCASVRRIRIWEKQALIDELVKIGGTLDKKLPLILTKDEAVLWVSEHREAVRQFFSIPLPDHQTVLQLMDKQRFHAWAAGRGLPVPKSFLISSVEQAADAARAIVFPAILKPQIKNEAYRASWLPKAFRLESPADLESVYIKVARYEQQTIVQEWIEGGDENVVYALGCWSAESRPLGLFFGRKIRQWPLGHGNTAHTEPAPAEWRELMRPLVTRIAQESNFQGLNSVEFKIDARTGKPYITEPTVCRTDYQSEVAVLNGVNLPQIACRDVWGDPPKETIEPAGPPVKWIDARADMRAGRRLINNGNLTAGDLISSYRGKRFFVYFRINDPLPWLGRLVPTRVASRL